VQEVAPAHMAVTSTVRHGYLSPVCPRGRPEPELLWREFTRAQRKAQ
jgi:hypothetical protein